MLIVTQINSSTFIDALGSIFDPLNDPLFAKFMM